LSNKEGNNIKNKKLVIIGIIIILVTITLCGCNENDPTAIKTGGKGKILLKSDIVELSESDFEIIKISEWDMDCACEVEHIKRIDVSYLFHNLAGKDVAAEVTLELYDKEGDILWISPSPKTIHLPEDYTEKGFTPANTISYDGSRLESVYSAVLVVEEGVW